ncbi:hypothetical protein BDR26DRAFT_934374 [Obelidium mucronatum]|nr:hypothetical protein BDR26DRAFT_934374 [Obelidium mucronatum]
METLPNELMSHLYAWLPLQTILLKSTKLNKKHRIFALDRIKRAIQYLDLTLEADSLESRFGNDDIQVPRKYRMAKNSVVADAAGAVSFIWPKEEIHPNGPLMFQSRISLNRVKMVIKEDYYSGCAWDKSMESQMGVLLTTDERVSVGRAFVFLDARFPPEHQVREVAIKKEHSMSVYSGIDSAVLSVTGIVCGFENDVVLHSWSMDQCSISLATAANDGKRCNKNRVEKRTVRMNWDLVLFNEKAKEMGAVLNNVQVPFSAILDSLFNYRPGLSDLDTEDGDSEWMSEDANSVFGDLEGGGYYDENYDNYHDEEDEYDSDGYASGF